VRADPRGSPRRAGLLAHLRCAASTLLCGWDNHWTTIADQK
jgi:hypothetical protein